MDCAERLYVNVRRERTMRCLMCECWSGLTRLITFTIQFTDAEMCRHARSRTKESIAI